MEQYSLAETSGGGDEFASAADNVHAQGGESGRENRRIHHGSGDWEGRRLEIEAGQRPLAERIDGPLDHTSPCVARRRGVRGGRTSQAGPSGGVRARTSYDVW